MFHVPEKFRILEGSLRSSSKDGNNGAFIINCRDGLLYAIASDGAPEGTQKWEHVSVSGRNGKISFTPKWDHMCMIKDLFWDEEDVVIQYHPKKSEYINMHSHCLHMWRPVGIELPTPPKIAVGY